METIIYIVLTLVLTMVMTPSARRPEINPEAFADVDFPQADEGTPQAVFFGECWTSDWTVLAVGDYRTTQIISDGGGK